MTTRDFLVELGTEELPPKSLISLSNAFTKGIVEALTKANITFGDVTSFAAPRRLAVKISGVSIQQPDAEIEKRGPSCKAPQKAIDGFARSCGIESSDLQVLETNKGDYYIYRTTEKGTDTLSLLPAFVQESLNALPIPKRMRWGSSRIEFVRPSKWLVMLFGDEVVPATILGLESGRKTRGHRFHYNHEIELIDASEYEAKLLAPGYVIADFATRRAKINSQVIDAGVKIGGTVEIDPDLLDEVTALNEWPVALTGRFEERFLDVPAEALILSMKENQKYFHAVDADGKLMPYFITVANIESKDPQQVIEGNEKVIRPRLADAAFFYETDKKSTLASRVEKLSSVVFQNQLGTVLDKATRISALAGHIAVLLHADVENAKRAGYLAKGDLLSDMVFEFTDLQGLMGYHYALHDGEQEEVAIAINEQYLPKFAGDDLPQSNAGIAVALADRLDTLTGLFGINQPPTGSKDPFALRRASLGVLRIIIERKLDLDLKDLVTKAVSLHASLPAAATAAEKATDFMLERLRAWYEDKGVSIDSYLAVVAVRPTNPLDFDKRVNAVNSFKTLPEAASLAAANKRVSNILEKNKLSTESTVNISLLEEAEEIKLHSSVEALQTRLQPLFAAGDYTHALAELASLQADVDAFFDSVMVMADDESVRNNRLALLSNLRDLFLRTADISLLNS
ncbi:glycine--tRNA ligase subunit beta [Neptunomonas antarctica]|uniref:Glycine--tRNA ligase beta subunit n=1 Tax=Neptunomonas antarctica TaxID=619304 RepID=A0A1N7ITR0_9GAMM|nr:glycine--tRNA ligase subunit beta [Neptunomonas antarctica]SIS40489.1 glycyl-tRNA synthetase beta chain [Neptunomonas antarctica]